jgi:cell division protein FtsN
MKTALVYLATGALAIFLLQGCGPSEEELREQERARQQAVQDSLQLVYQAQMEEMRQDSIEQARRDSIAEAEARSVFEHSDTGMFTVQVQSWRTREKANSQAAMWRERGFDHAFVTEYGSEETGNIWYRVRLGRFETEEIAENVRQSVMEEYQADSWISRIG